MPDEFFNKTETETETKTETVEKVKVGSDEYTQDELSKLVGLGKIGVEAEQKFNTKLDRVWPEFVKSSQEKAELNAKVKEFEGKIKDMETKKSPALNSLTSEQKEQAKKELYELMGGEPMTEKQFEVKYVQRRNAERLVEDTESVLLEMKEQGMPQTTVEDVLKHMADTGIRVPQKAYKDMFEAEIDKIKEEKLKSLRPSGGYETVQVQSPGNKQPALKKVTKENLAEMLNARINRV